MLHKGLFPALNLDFTREIFLEDQNLLIDGKSGGPVV